MRPRIVFRTHYQVDEPAYMKFLVKLCTSPVLSSYREVVAEKLAREITSRGKKLNVAAGGYAVDLAHDLDLITPNNTWSEKGHLVNLITDIEDGYLDNQLKLTLSDKLLYFRVFLEADGAALLFISRRLKGCECVANSDLTWNSWAKEMFVEVYSDYLSLTSSTADRVELRRAIERIGSRGYEGNTGSHKIFIHMQTLYRLGLLTRPELTGTRSYQLPPIFETDKRGLETLVEEIPDVLSLERMIEARKWPELAVKVFQLTTESYCENINEESVDRTLTLFAPSYYRVITTGVPLCSLSTLIEAVQISLISNFSIFLSFDDAQSLIIAAQKERPKEIRFHVDRRGQPAFIKLSDNILKNYTS
ncbi:MAG: hypothetical protein A2W35_04850 [Chloroflexi bacterium RBG_16_57_11]|nr:MAG: hypothetical protein A2W35_04850 [Chloroflexi bacterium RBG_16_57_11]